MSKVLTSRQPEPHNDNPTQQTSIHTYML